MYSAKKVAIRLNAIDDKTPNKTSSINSIIFTVRILYDVEAWNRGFDLFLLVPMKNRAKVSILNRYKTPISSGNRDGNRTGTVAFAAPRTSRYSPQVFEPQVDERKLYGRMKMSSIGLQDLSLRSP